MIKRWLCLLLVSAFMLQSVAAGLGVHEFGHSSADHQAASLDDGQGSHADAAQDCDVHQHGHCCHGHFSATLSSHEFDFPSADNRFSANYIRFIPVQPPSELLRPPTV